MNSIDNGNVISQTTLLLTLKEPKKAGERGEAKAIERFNLCHSTKNPTHFLSALSGSIYLASSKASNVIFQFRNRNRGNVSFFLLEWLAS